MAPLRTDVRQKEIDMIAIALLIAAAAAYAAVRIHALSGSLPRGNDDMIFY
jgi:hypothetical protein